MIDDKKSDERDQSGENDKERFTDDIEVLNQDNCVARDIQIMLTNNMTK